MFHAHTEKKALCFLTPDGRRFHAWIFAILVTAWYCTPLGLHHQLNSQDAKDKSSSPTPKIRFLLRLSGRKLGVSSTCTCRKGRKGISTASVSHHPIIRSMNHNYVIWHTQKNTNPNSNEGLLLCLFKTPKKMAYNKHQQTKWTRPACKTCRWGGMKTWPAVGFNLPAMICKTVDFPWAVAVRISRLMFFSVDRLLFLWIFWYTRLH